VHCSLFSYPDPALKLELESKVMMLHLTKMHVQRQSSRCLLYNG